MALTAGTVLIEVKGLLNDPAGAIYPDPALIPLLRKSYVELQTKLSALGSSTIKDRSIPIVVDSGTLSLGDGSGLPNDFLMPIELLERTVGSTSMQDYIPMEEKIWEPHELPKETLRFWTWREETLYFVGATTPREVLLRYKKTLVPITDSNSPIQINNSQTWLAQRTASIAALLIGSNPNRASALMEDLNGQNGPWEDLKATIVHRMQSIPVRRRRTRWRKR